ncbi:hypothetical protein NADFUDRAFT_49009 [Nadsonia fulvescens var. elongata DSM 6958]|uniref:Uncharacterized protein n=1 Tax=Nadsonia fulvescens var. elongata DSM 6958 TaxID=857566 RepID=A0A1E3PSX5_9ASCO|nr:hypothetical protein NADFUDRAFT_49009 [Nadsonia fulvescens var. elongata DSM 6958]
MLKVISLLSRYFTPYIQFYHHQKRRSVAGLSIDFAIWSTLGPFLHLIYSLIYYFSATIHSQWSNRYPTGVSPAGTWAQINSPGGNLWLDMHNWVIWFLGILALQALGQFRYTWNEEMEFSPIAQVIIIFASLVLLGGILSVEFGGGWLTVSGLVWLDVVDWIGLVGQWAEFVRYWPQISMHWLAQSTAGLATGFVWVDGLGALVALCGLYLRASQVQQSQVKDLGVESAESVWILMTRPTNEFFLAVGKLLVFCILVLQKYKWYAGQRSLIRRKYKQVSDVELNDLD